MSSVSSANEGTGMDSIIFGVLMTYSNRCIMLCVFASLDMMSLLGRPEAVCL